MSEAEFPSGPCSMAAGATAALAFLSRESRTRAGGVGGLRAPAPVTMDSFFFGIKKGGDEGDPGIVRDWLSNANADGCTTWVRV